MNTREKDVFVSHASIVNWAFPYKLWLAVNYQIGSAGRWDEGGTNVVFNWGDLQDYLQSPSSIFEAKSISIFMTQLTNFHFIRQNVITEEGEGVLMIYHNDDFKREHVLPLQKIGQPHIYNCNFDDSNNVELKVTTAIQLRYSEQQLKIMFEKANNILQKNEDFLQRFKTHLKSFDQFEHEYEDWVRKQPVFQQSNEFGSCTDCGNPRCRNSRPLIAPARVKLPVLRNLQNLITMNKWSRKQFFGNLQAPRFTKSPVMVDLSDDADEMQEDGEIPKEDDMQPQDMEVTPHEEEEQEQEQESNQDQVLPESHFEMFED